MAVVFFRPNRLETTLLLTAFAAGTVDVISFATLGAVLASAMTGNLALLAYHLARTDVEAAVGSIVALIGFVAGCLLGEPQRHGHSREAALRRLLNLETTLLLGYAVLALWAPPGLRATLRYVEIGLLSTAMGAQAILGQAAQLTTIVFTTTLTKLVSAFADAIGSGASQDLGSARTGTGVLISYLLGAFMAGVLVVRSSSAVALLPVLSIACASIAQRGWRR